MDKKHILFLGTHGQYNIGDELLLETFLAQLGSEHHYMVNSYDPAFTRQRLGDQYSVEVFDTGGSKVQFMRRILAADLVFFGGGSIIKELYASVGRHRYSTLLIILLTVFFARRIAGKPVLMSNIGIGPLLSPGGERLAAWILRQVNYLAVRDRKSFSTSQRLGVPAARLRQVPDAVFALSQADLGLAQLAPPTDGRLHIALNLNYNIENPDNWEPFLASLAEGLAAFAARHPLVIHGLPMQAGFKKHDDLQELTAFRARIPHVEMILHTPQDHCEVAAILAGCHLVVAERLHALVIATILERPFLSLMYDVKVRELTAGLEMLAYAIDINQPFVPERLVERLELLHREQQTVQAHLAGCAVALRHDLADYFGYVRQLMAKLA
jgi:polysaccharide pyruvyl transferase WcaK-like protein